MIQYLRLVHKNRTMMNEYHAIKVQEAVPSNTRPRRLFPSPNQCLWHREPSLINQSFRPFGLLSPCRSTPSNHVKPSQTIPLTHRTAQSICVHLYCQAEVRPSVVESLAPSNPACPPEPWRRRVKPTLKVNICNTKYYTRPA